MGDRSVVLSVASLLLCAGCEQILGIRDPQPNTSGTGIDARVGGVVMDAPGTGGGSGSGSNSNACATVPSFGGVTKYSAANAIAFAIGDVDRDGKKDAVVVTRTMTAGDVLIYPGIQGGGFGGAHALRSTATLATGVLIADVDADGSNDIVTWEGMSPIAGNQSSFSVSVHRQNINAAGTFLTPQTISFGQNPIKGVVAGNLNGDTLTDLVVQTNSPDETYPYFASTSTPGAYTKGTLIASGMTPSHVLDIDGDTYDDVAFTRQSTGLALYFNKPASPGTFSAAAVGAGMVTNASFGRYGSTTRMDVVVFGDAAPLPGTGVLWEQTSARSFVQRSGTVDMTSGGVYTAGGGLPTVDINADGRDDVVLDGRAVIQCPTVGTFWPTKSSSGSITFGDMQAAGMPMKFTDINGGPTPKPDLIGIDSSGGTGGNFLEVWLQ